jgi:hypothetical protein
VIAAASGSLGKQGREQRGRAGSCVGDGQAGKPGSGNGSRPRCKEAEAVRCAAAGKAARRAGGCGER